MITEVKTVIEPIKKNNFFNSPPLQEVKTTKNEIQN